MDDYNLSTTSLPPGLYKLGKIDSIYPDTNIAKVSIDSSRSVTGVDQIVHDVDITYPFIDNNGVFVGSLPSVGTPVILLQGPSNKHQIASYQLTNKFNRPTLNPGELLLQTGEYNKILINQDDDLIIGLGNKDLPGSIHIKPINNIINTNFYRQVSFSQGSRRVDGIIKREKVINNIYSGDQKLYSDDYDNILTPIGLDPTLNTSYDVQNQNKNPAFVESRNLIYEFSYNSNVKDLNLESDLYKTSTPKSSLSQNLNNRRKSRVDTLSLTLADPNYLMESISGTVVDIYGNILDLNRYPLPIGIDKLTLKSTNNSGKIDKDKAYLDIRAEQRKSIAYHFELNARKSVEAIVNAPGINDLDLAAKNYARDRSRFYLDIDKEGQFKLNIPASSEIGNISLLARYENYSTLYPDGKQNPDGNVDIVLDSFAAGLSERNQKYQENKDQYLSYNKGVISILKNGVEITPKDRFFSQDAKVYHLKHGTAYHDISSTCLTHQIDTFVAYLYDTVDNFSEIFPQSSVTPINFDLVSKKIEIGDNANAGGRSGQINLDGSIELNIGANTVDRQSIWLDTAGGMIANLGRDLNGISAAISMDGALCLQVGGYGIVGDTRFKSKNNAFIPGIIDIRVMSHENRVVVVRIDQYGVNIISPTAVTVQSNGNMTFQSNATMFLNAEKMYIQNREVYKDGAIASYI